MTVQVTGLPDEFTSKVEITLPNGSTQAYDWEAGFIGDIPGEYRVTGETVRIPGEIIDLVYEAAPVSGRLDEGGSGTLALRYAQRPGSGMMWVFTTRTDDEDGHDKAHARAIDAATLARGGFSSPSRNITLPPRLYGGAALPNGDLLYVDDWDNRAVMRLSKAAQGGNGAPEPWSASRIGFVNVDPRGRLWISTADFADRYPASVLASGTLGEPEAKYESNWDHEDRMSMSSMIFDHDGSVVALGNGSIARVPASHFGASGDVRFPWRVAHEGGANQVAIDREGNVWATFEYGSVVKFSKEEVEASGEVHGTAYEVPMSVCGITIDNSGGVWILIRWTGELFRLAPGESSFAKVGFMGTGYSESSRLTLNPPPAWSPLAAAPGFPVMAGRKGD